jgi:branched-chain amino acid transport system substrate-binding protein
VGELATFGRSLGNGSVLAFDEWNSRGGVLGQRLEWTVYDAPCDFKAASQAAQHAVADGFHFIIGPLCSDAAIAVAQVVDENAETTLMIAPAATHPLVTVDGQGQTRSTVFRASYIYSLQARAAARFAAGTLHARRAALLVDPHDDYSTALAGAFSTEFAAQGGQIVYSAPYASTEPDFTQILQASGEAEAEVIYLPAAAPVVNRVAGQLGRSNPNGLILLGSDSWDSAELDLAAAAGSYFTLHFFVEDNRPLTRQWTDAYKAAYAVEPDTLAALGYEAANILVTAIEQAGTFEIKTVAKTLAQGRFEGVAGPITFDPQHNPIKPAPVVQIKDGRIIFTTYVNLQDEDN